MYPFMTLDDDTEIVHSEMLPTAASRSTLKSRMRKIAFTPLSAICRIIPGSRSAAFPLPRSTATRNFWKPRHINNSGIPPRILRNIMAIIEARSEEVLAKWKNFFGEVRYFC